jgi:FkbM family methyltransferase
VVIDEVCGHTFLNRRPLSVVVDLGVHDGEFTDALAHRYGATVFGAEAVGALAHARGCEWAAIGSQSGHVELRQPLGANASAILDIGGPVERVPAMTLGDFFEKYEIETVDLLKMDIEGSELDVIGGDPERLLVCEQITVEYHDFLDASLAPRVTQARARMRQLGFTEIRFSGDNTDILYLRTPPPALTRLWLIIRYRYAAGFMRRARRRFLTL